MTKASHFLTALGVGLILTAASGVRPASALERMHKLRAAPRGTAAEVSVASGGGPTVPSYYVLTELPVLPGFAESTGFAVNESGQVAGFSGLHNSDRHAFVFTDANANLAVDDGEMIDLGTFGGPASSGQDINNLGEVVGYALTDTETYPDAWLTHVTRGFWWADGVMTNLGSLPNYPNISIAEGVNDSDLVVGYTVASTAQAFVWDPTTSSMTALPGFPGVTRVESIAYDVNDNRVIAGYSRGSMESPAVVAALWIQSEGAWEAVYVGAFMPLGGTGLEAPRSTANAVNAGGQVVGWSSFLPPGFEYPVSRAFVVSPVDGAWYRDEDGNGINDLMLELGTLGGSISSAFSINDWGHVVGTALTEELQSHAFLWIDGVMYDLNDLLHSDDAGWQLSYAYDINNRGQIVGSGHNAAGEYRGFLLTPVEGDCNFNGVPDDEEIAAGTSPDCNGNNVPDECEPDCNANGTADECDISAQTSADCNGNGVPNECESDCNGNGNPDDCDIALGSSEDCTGNGIPDECEADCNENGTADSCDLAAGTSEDCDNTTIPDECEIAADPVRDCNHNAIPDSCDIAAGTSPDCNNNTKPDECDITGRRSDDCNSNDVPDECEMVDCNSNGALDFCDVADGTSLDSDSNGVPDECDGRGFSLVPVDASGKHWIEGREILLGRPGQRVFFDLRLSGWDLDLDGDPLLRSYQAQIDSAGFTSGAAGSLTLPYIPIPCSTDDDCPGWGSNLCDGAVCRANGAFLIDEAREDYVFAGLETISAADVSQPDVRLGATVYYPTDSVEDIGIDHYVGSLALDVSADATGVFTVGFRNDPLQTFLVADDNYPITIPTLNPAIVRISELSPNSWRLNRFGRVRRDPSPVAAAATGAIRVRLAQLYVDRERDAVNGCPVRGENLPALASFEGDIRYLGPPSEYSQGAAGPMLNFIAARLQCEPYYRDWSEEALAAEFSADADVSRVYFFGEAVLPCSMYEVQEATQSCIESGDPEACASPREEVWTAVWGDIVEPANLVNFMDIAALVQCYKGAPLQAGENKTRCLLRGNAAPPDEPVSFLDIAQGVNAYKTLPFEGPGPQACP